MKMNVGLLVLVLLLVPELCAQQAKVIQLEGKDAAEAKKLYEMQETAKKAFADFQKRISKKYVLAQPGEDESNCMTGTIGSTEKPAPVKKGWGCGGFSFSDDFRFIVPDDSDQPPAIPPEVLKQLLHASRPGA